MSEDKKETETLSAKQSSNKSLNKKILIGFGVVILVIVGFSVIGSMASKSPSTSKGATVTPKKSALETQFPDVYNFSNDSFVQSNHPKIKNLQYYPADSSVGNVATVNVDFTDDNTTNSMVKYEMADAYIAVNKDVPNLGKIAVTYYGNLTDSYGNNSTGIVYETDLEADAISKINWKADTSDLQGNILPNNWSVIYKINGF